MEVPPSNRSGLAAPPAGRRCWSGLRCRALGSARSPPRRCLSQAHCSMPIGLERPLCHGVGAGGET